MFKAEQEQEKSDFETALELQKQLDEREEVVAQAHDIDWSDLVMLRYHTLQNRPFSVCEEKSKMKLLVKESAKKQKLEDDTEKEELQVYLNIVPEDESLNIESLATKYPIVDWETHILANDKYYYQIKRADGSTSAKVKTVNGERQIQALVDKKKVIISETDIRNDLKLDDVEGTYCLPTATIFAELERIGVESSNDASLGAQEDASKQGKKIEDLDADAEVTLVNETQEMNDDNLMFDTSVLEEQEIKFENVVMSPLVNELTLAQILIEIKTAKPKLVTTAPTTVTFCKGKMVELEVPLKKKDQVALDKEMARNLKAQLQAKLIEEERLTRKKEEEANIALIES
ncbi:hypothetical protein Tco_1056124 [Tanacetum coccineum]|uniref:Uncharacterized protein n=1 Tax=Tanacetum coccineum TaxID=301880 RepID=A0ABQ5H1M4_9ASTR